MLIKEIQLPIFPYKSRRGVAERLVKKYFMRQGFEVYRGARIMGWHTLRYFMYPNVRRVYDRVEFLLRKKLQASYPAFRARISHKGLPDFFLYRKYPGECWMFVEAKLGNECLGKHQLKQLQFLEESGFLCAVVRVKKALCRIEIKRVYENRRVSEEVLLKQQKIRLRYPKDKALSQNI